MKKFLMAICLLVLLMPTLSLAQEATSDRSAYEVTGIISEFESRDDLDQPVFWVETKDGASYRVDSSKSYIEGLRYDLGLGDQVILQILPNRDGTESAFLADVVRLKSLFWIFAFFALLIILVGLWRGLLALSGLVVTVALVFGVLFPKILSGADPLWTTLIVSVAILAINIPLCHGLSKITATAFLGTLGGLFSSVILAKWFTSAAALSGLANEEAIFFSWEAAQIDPRGILLAAIILGAVGVFDDVAITQAESVSEIAKANPDLSANELYKRAMRIGRHHIASMVNTLVLAYVAVAMPLFLLFMQTTAGWLAFINTEMVAEEIVRILAGTSALILTVPLTTWLAAKVSRHKTNSLTH